LAADFTVEVIEKLNVGTAGGWLECLVRPIGVPRRKRKQWHPYHRMHNPRTSAASLKVALSDVHPWLELADLDAGGDIGHPQRGVASHNVEQAPANLAS
jgi:hypothetical protein